MCTAYRPVSVDDLLADIESARAEYETLIRSASTDTERIAAKVRFDEAKNDAYRRFAFGAVICEV